MGSLGALAVAYGLVAYADWRPLWFLWLTAAATAPAIWASDLTARSGACKDPSHVVVDEVLGQWLALAGATALNWKSWLGAFLLFRALDIAKPWPIRRFERLPGGTGIVADDLAAGAVAALVLFGAGCFNLY